MRFFRQKRIREIGGTLGGKHAVLMGPKYSTWLFAFLMGLQNGMVVSFKGILVRFTHMTGNLTDFPMRRKNATKRTPGKSGAKQKK